MCKLEEYVHVCAQQQQQKSKLLRPREQWRWTVADDASHGGKTWLKWNENFFDKPARRSFKSLIKKRCKQKHWKSFNSMLSKQVGNCLACSAGSQEEKWRQIEPNRSQIEANFPKSALACFNSRKINECRMKSRSAKSLIPNLHKPKPTDTAYFGNWEKRAKWGSAWRSRYSKMWRT